MLRDWTADLRTRALRLRRMRGLVTEAVRLLRADRRRRIDAVIDYFGDSPRRRRYFGDSPRHRRAATYAEAPRHVASG